jgi:hypothetical protein
MKRRTFGIYFAYTMLPLALTIASPLQALGDNPGIYGASQLQQHGRPFESPG